MISPSSIIIKGGGGMLRVKLRNPCCVCGNRCCILRKDDRDDGRVVLLTASLLVAVHVDDNDEHGDEKTGDRVGDDTMRCKRSRAICHSERDDDDDEDS